MSEYYWNEYIKFYVDEEMVKHTLKYHQRSVSKWVVNEKLDKSKINLIQADKLKVSDVKVDTICIENLEKTTQNILSNLKPELFTANYPTVIVLGLKGKRLITTGVSCSMSTMESFDNAIKEAKIIEWQQYNNIQSEFWRYSDTEMQDIYKIIDYKSKTLKSIDIFSDKYLNSVLDIKSWVGDIYLKIVSTDEKTGLKTIKCVSDQLLSALPIYSNILKSMDKEIIRRYFINKEVDCPIV